MIVRNILILLAALISIAAKAEYGVKWEPLSEKIFLCQKDSVIFSLEMQFGEVVKTDGSNFVKRTELRLTLEDQSVPAILQDFSSQILKTPLNQISFFKNSYSSGKLSMIKALEFTPSEKSAKINLNYSFDNLQSYYSGANIITFSTTQPAQKKNMRINVNNKVVFNLVSDTEAILSLNLSVAEAFLSSDNSSSGEDKIPVSINRVISNMSCKTKQ